LKGDLQKAALNLIQHLGTHHFRIRIEGSMPALYITLGEGRSSYSADSVIYHVPQQDSPEQVAAEPAAPEQVAPEQVSTPAQVAAQANGQRAPLVACFSRLKKMLVA